MDLSIQQISVVQHQRTLVEQLRREASLKRINVSQAVEDLKVIWPSFLNDIVDFKSLAQLKGERGF